MDVRCVLMDIGKEGEIGESSSLYTLTHIYTWEKWDPVSSPLRHMLNRRTV